MPVMGARTVEMAAAAGLAGVGGVAGQADPDRPRRHHRGADRLGLFVWGERDAVMSRPLKIMLVAAEASGDALGAGLARALKARLGDDVVFVGVGGPADGGPRACRARSTSRNCPSSAGWRA